MRCRACSNELSRVFLDLGTAPPSNAYLREAQLALPETWFPLKLHTCEDCLLVQVDEVERHDRLFDQDYAYFSSYSSSWLRHAEHFVDEAVSRLGLGPRDLVVEVASNDGYLLQYVQARGIDCLGIEPTTGTAGVAREKGIETITEFFGKGFAQSLRGQRGAAKLLVGNNVLAHVPDINDFVAGIRVMLAPDGVATLEFPHLMELVRHRQFDTVYHEHFSYLSLHTTMRVFASQGLRIWDVQRLPTHGGSLRIWVCHEEDARETCPSVGSLARLEKDEGMLELAWYDGFQDQAEGIKHAFLSFLLEQRRSGKSVVGYGAAAKGNTLMNFAGVRSDLIQFVADASPHKQGLYLPGSRIPVVAPAELIAARPDFVVVLPWNLFDEVSEQLSCIREWGGKFVRAVPELVVS